MLGGGDSALTLNLSGAKPRSARSRMRTLGRFDVMHEALSVKARAGAAVFLPHFPDRRMLRRRLAEAHAMLAEWTWETPATGEDYYSQ